jgi:tRNA threonylcarbamoyladenosine biosynthesis protein TsaE
MSTVQTWQTECDSLEVSLALAAQIGAKLRGGEVIELVSDLGGGKTAFVRGLAKGMGSADKVHSPSFTLSNVYQAGDLRLHHFDFHRLNEPGIMRNELGEILNDPNNVIVIEWADIVTDILPPERLTINIRPTNESSRHYMLSYPEELNHLFPIT